MLKRKKFLLDAVEDERVVRAIHDIVGFVVIFRCCRSGGGVRG